MRVSGRLLFAALAGGALLALTQSACSSFSAADAESTDASTDTGASTAPGAADLPDAAPDAVDAAHFCEGHADALLCSDFDEGYPAVQSFSTQMGDVSVVDGGAASPPGALRVASPNAGFVSYELQALPTAAAEQRLSFAMSLDSLDAGAIPQTGFNFAGITSGKGCGFYLQFSEGAARLVVSPEGRTFDPTPLDVFPQGATWSTYDLILKQTGNVVTATVLFNGVKTGVTNVATACTSLVSASVNGNVFVGFDDVGSSIPGEARFDNVLFEQQ